MKELLELKNLHALNLKFTKVTVAGLHELRELKSLRTLILGNNKETDRSYVDALKAELPNVAIFEESYGR